jgi:integrase/recombinase XerD
MHVTRAASEDRLSNRERGAMTEGTLQPLVTTYNTRRRKQGTYTAESVRTVAPRLASLARSYGRRPLDQFGRRAIERWLESLEHLATNSRASYLASAREFTKWLNVEGYTTSDACALVPKAKRAKSVPRAQTTAAVAKVLDACNDDRERAIVMLMVECGLRRAEVARLRWEDYDHRAATILVHGKGQRERLLPVPQAAQDALARIHLTATGPIIRSKRDGAAMRPVTIGKLAAAAMYRAGVKLGAWDGVSGHALRHTCASDVLDRCHDLRVVSSMLGHETLTSTSIYLRRATAEQIRAAMEGRDYADVAHAPPVLRRVA